MGTAAQESVQTFLVLLSQLKPSLQACAYHVSIDGGEYSCWVETLHTTHDLLHPLHSLPPNARKPRKRRPLRRKRRRRRRRPPRKKLGKTCTFLFISISLFLFSLPIFDTTWTRFCTNHQLEGAYLRFPRGSAGGKRQASQLSHIRCPLHTFSFCSKAKCLQLL